MSNSYKVSDYGLEQIIEHEGEVLEVYKDPIGLPTLGVGHLLTPAEVRRMPVGTKITKAESRAFLKKDLARFERCVNDAVTVKLNQNQFDALVSFAFNIGEDRFENSTLLKILNKGDYTGAANQFKRWVLADGERLSGLVIRREKEKTLFLKKFSPVADSAADSRPTVQPDPVSGGAQEDPNLSTAASPSVPTDKDQAGSIGDTASSVADAATGWLNKAGNIQEGVARASFLSRFGRWFLTVFSLATTFIYANWEIFLLALLLTAVILWYLFVVRPKRSGGSGTE